MDDLASMAAPPAEEGLLAGVAALRSDLWRQLPAAPKGQALTPCAEEASDAEGCIPADRRGSQDAGQRPVADVAAAAAAAAAGLVQVVPPVAMGPHVGPDGEAFFSESAATTLLPPGLPAPPPAIPPPLPHAAALAAPSASPSASASVRHSRSSSLLSGHSPLASGGSSPSLSLSGAPTGRGTSFDLCNASMAGVEGHAAEELFYRLNHARQTVDFVKRQAASFSGLARARLDVWQALGLCNELREFEAALHGDAAADAGMPLLDHALQTAEACRLAFPQNDWMALVGLLHGLGKLLAHGALGAEPQWAVCGESFPVGCRFHPAVVHAHFFQANPDRRRRAYASPTGVYQPGCGLQAVCMSWSAAEYLYMVLAMNRTRLPPEALFVLRYQKFAALLRPGRPYGELLSEFDRGMLPTLGAFAELAAYRRREVPGALEGAALREHYDALLEKYIPQGELRW